jgi:hypothetical protein
MLARAYAIVAVVVPLVIGPHSTQPQRKHKRRWTCARCAGAHRHGPWTTHPRCPPPAPSTTCPPPSTIAFKKNTPTRFSLPHRIPIVGGHQVREETAGET